jgi:hypothetical protein
MSCEKGGFYQWNPHGAAGEALCNHFGFSFFLRYNIPE